MPRLERDQALRLAQLFATVRIVVGVGSLVAPRLAARLLLHAPGRDHVVVVRMFAGRELAMGLGAVLAARSGPHAVRSWVEAGGLADGVDATAFLLDLLGRRGTARRATALMTTLTAGSAAATAPILARALSAGDGPADTDGGSVAPAQ